MKRLVCTTMMGMTVMVMATAGAAASAQRVATAPSRDATSRDAAARDADALLARRVTLHITRVTLAQALDAVATAAGVPVQYRAQVVDAYSNLVTVHVTQISLRAALEAVLTGTSLRVVADGPTQLAVIASEERSPRQGAIAGRVTEARSAQPARGVRVTLGVNDDALMTTRTDDEGRYRFAHVSAGVYRVTARSVGFTRQTKVVTVTEDSTTTVNLALESSVNTLDQVVVTGTVIPTELKAVPNAMTVITAKDIERRGITRVDQLFRGEVPGVFATNLGSGALLDQVTMFSRGATALFPSSAGIDQNTGITNPIKTYVDGVELADPTYLNQIDPKSIERIEILTGPQASTIYGSNAINGVMQIFTKRGTNSTPQLTLTLLNGWVENNFRSTRTPQHDYDVRLNGIEGRMSYNAGGSWNYIGPWTPAKQTTRTGGFGGARLELPTTAGRVTADMTFRRGLTQNLQRGDAGQTGTGYREIGWYANSSSSGLSIPATSTLTGQTLGVALTYTPTSWWSHELGVGTDASDTETRWTARGYRLVRDTTLYIQQTHADRRSLRYATTTRMSMTSLVQATMTVGADAWQNLTSAWSVQPQTLTGSLTGATSISRQPEHNTGGFLQTQLGVSERLFFTYGLRAEWNPNYGAEAQPNYAPRYGIAYTQDLETPLGVVTAKLRGSYGRSTRPPASSGKAAQTIVEFLTSLGASSTQASILPYFGNFDHILANAELAPEHQQGGEGGLELYFGTRGSLVVTRYNQAVDGLIAQTKVDSVRSLTLNPPNYDVLNPDGYGYMYQYQNLNMGSIRNQGWELQGSVNTGPFTTKGTYSWTKSRVIGVAPRYRAIFSSYSQYQPGATFNYLPEHTWAFAVAYAHAQTTVAFNVTGTGRATNGGNDFYYRNFYSGIRLPQNRLNMNFGTGYSNVNNGYALTDLTGSHQFLPQVEGVFQIQNLMDRYTNDLSGGLASIGRQTKIGARIKW